MVAQSFTFARGGSDIPPPLSTERTLPALAEQAGAEPSTEVQAERPIDELIEEATRARDRLNAERRRLPMVKIDKEYRFEGSDGTASLLDLFDGRRQLIIYHFMFDPSWDDGCPAKGGCCCMSVAAD